MFFSVVKRGMPKSLRSCHCATSLSPKCANSLILTPIYIRSFSPFISIPFRMVRHIKFHPVSLWSRSGDILISFLVLFWSQNEKKARKIRLFRCYIRWCEEEVRRRDGIVMLPLFGRRNEIILLFSLHRVTPSRQLSRCRVLPLLSQILFAKAANLGVHSDIVD